MSKKRVAGTGWEGYFDPMNETQQDLDYTRIEKAIRFLDRRRREQPSLDEVAREVHLSPFHFERLFVRWAGVSPKKYLQYLTKEHAKALLRSSATVLDAAYESGLSSPGRLHDLLVTFEGVTPGEMRGQGEGLEIAYGVEDSPFGLCLVGMTARGVCMLQFVEEASLGRELLAEEWPRARLMRDDGVIRPLVRRIFEKSESGRQQGLKLFLKGTDFQLTVWQALLRIPAGSVTTYLAIARSLGRKTASRAVGTAIGSNPVGYLIPCHRVLKSTGEISGYRWGVERKTAMLFREAMAQRLAA